MPTFRNISPDRPAPKETELFYYQHHIGDYRRDTGHLTLLEHGIYRQLLDQYYLTEKPIDSTTIRLLSIRNTDECESYYRVLADFFVERDGVFFHKRCDFEIQRFKEKSEKATQSIKARWNKNKDLSVSTNVLPTNNEGNTNQSTNKPINQSTNDKETKPKKDAPRLAVMPEGMDEGIWADFQTVRKKKNAPLTITALNGLAEQANKAGLSLEAVLKECVVRNWQSLKADWIKPQGATNGKFNAYAYTSEVLARELASQTVGNGSSQEVFDVVPTEIFKLLPESGGS